MDNVQFSKSFGFNSYSFKQNRHTDNSGGTRSHHIGVIKKGSAVFVVGDKRYEFGEGDVFYTPIGCRYHSYWSGEQIEYDSYAFRNFICEADNEYGVQKLKLTEVALHALSELDKNREVSSKSVGLLYILLGEALPFMQPTVRDSRREVFLLAQSFIRDNVVFSAKSLARHLRISESGMYALFAQFGTTPVNEKHKIRCEQARELLLTTDKTIDEISGMLGFSSAAYFRKVFLKEFGNTPSEMRKISTKSL
ncbi:MAG: helix-turn-helix transcriptional regulator [Clostridia bacterium]|nr:helix-turn-helix transcriptional regulator [Clostridia bacterium]